MRNYIMTTALFVSAIAVNGAFAEETPVLKVDTTSQEKIEAANEVSSQTETASQADNTKNTDKDASDAKAEANTAIKAQKESSEAKTEAHTDNTNNADKKASDAKAEATTTTETQNTIAQKKQSDDIVTNSIKTDDEAEKTEPQGVLDKIFAYFSGE